MKTTSTDVHEDHLSDNEQRKSSQTASSLSSSFFSSVASSGSSMRDSIVSFLSVDAPLVVQYGLRFATMRQFVLCIPSLLILLVSLLAYHIGFSPSRWSHITDHVYLAKVYNFGYAMRVSFSIMLQSIFFAAVNLTKAASIHVSMVMKEKTLDEDELDAKWSEQAAATIGFSAVSALILNTSITAVRHANQP
jgi:hypothetical protein